MPFDTQAFRAVMDRIAGSSYAFHQERGPIENTGRKALGRLNPRLQDKYRFRLTGLGDRPPSNHRRLRLGDFTRERIGDLAALEALLRSGTPAIDQEQLTFSFTLHGPSKTEPRFEFDLMGGKLAPSPVHLSTLAEKMECFAERLEGVPRPGTRAFIIDGRRIRARDATSALKLFGALHSPKIFDPEMHETLIHRIDVSELLETRPLFEALAKT